MLLHLTVLVTLFPFQLPPLLPTVSVSLLTFAAPSQALLTFLKFLSVFSLFLQLRAATGKPSPAAHARTLAFLALAALGPAAAIDVPEQVTTDARLPALLISIELLHYYRYQPPFSSFSSSFFLQLVIWPRLVFRILVDLR